MMYTRITILLFRYPIISNMIISILLIIMSKYTSERADCMQNDDNNNNNIIEKEMAQRRIDNDLLFEVTQPVLERINILANAQDRQTYYQEMLEIQQGALNAVIDNVHEETSIRERIRGYEAVLIFVGVTAIGFLVINY